MQCMHVNLTKANSSMNIANVGEAFAGTEATAHSLNVTSEQLTAMLMTLANNHIEASNVGNALSSTFMRLSKEPKVVADTLAKYNIAIWTQKCEMRTLLSIMKELYEQTMPKGEKVAGIRKCVRIELRKFDDSTSTGDDER